MPRLIDADALLVKAEVIGNEGVVYVYDINNAPTVDAEPIKHGHWCVTQAYPHTIYCSECFQRFAQAHWAIWEDGSLPRDYCPNCGAKMDGDRREDETD